MSLTDGLVNAMWGIIRNVDGYNHLDFLRDDFMISHFFVLTELLTEEHARATTEKKKQDRRHGKK